MDKPEFTIPPLWVLEYSPTQKAFHVESLDESIMNNLQNMFTDCLADYGIIGIFKTRDEASKAYFYFKTRKFNGKALGER